MAAAIAHADANNYSFGAKLVRGAYVESERKRWEIAGSVGDAPVWSNKAETDDCYDSCALMLEQRIAEEVTKGERKSGTGAFYASHNGTSVRKVLAALRDQGLVTVTDKGLIIDERIRGRVSFAQLLGERLALLLSLDSLLTLLPLGMSDNLTNALVSMTLPPAETDRNTVPIVVKSVPYASVDQALPYLIRR